MSENFAFGDDRPGVSAPVHLTDEVNVCSLARVRRATQHEVLGVEIELFLSRFRIESTADRQKQPNR